MSQIFRPRSNTIARLSIVGVVLLVCGIPLIGNLIVRGPYVTDVNVPREQPVPFSHQHHVGGLGIDCRYCHTSVEESSFAGIPPTETCMTCHSQIWADSPMLQPVRESYRLNRPLRWIRIHDLQDFVYFNHSIHVNKGVGCVTCHGRVDKMPLTYKVNTLHMKWCLSCHREPERYIRPRSDVFVMDYVAPGDQLAMGRTLVREYHINVNQLSNCSICHR